MKVFNFTKGTKGELLADVGSFRSAGDGLINGKLIGVRNEGKFKGYEFHNNFSAKVYGEAEVVYSPENFAELFGAGVEAVCFCMGHNLNLDRWEWAFCASHQWLADHHVPRAAIQVDWANFTGDLSKLNLGPVGVNDPF